MLASLKWPKITSIWPILNVSVDEFDINIQILATIQIHIYN